MFFTKNKKKLWGISLICALVFGGGYFIFIHHRSFGDVHMIWGDRYQTNELVRRIMDTPVMKRVKDIDQSGPAHFFGPKVPKFSRFEHCVGVWALLKKAGVGIEEQVTGLLHDVSYTVFSHVSDHLFAKKGNVNEYTQISYQDKNHMNYLNDSKLQEVLDLYNIKTSSLDPTNLKYSALEKPLPDMCADRIHYNIHTGVLTGMITMEEAKEIVDNLKFKNEKWFFTDSLIAKRFAELSLFFTQNFWGSKWNVAMNMHLAKALDRAIRMKLLKESDLYLTDSVVMQKLVKNQDPIIQLMLQQCKRPVDRIVGQVYKKIKFIPKFRGIDPLVETDDGSLKRLTEIDYMFQNHYDNIKIWCNTGFYVDVIVTEEYDDEE